ncbi:MAG: YqgE/AlgH family protein [Rhodospirillales bacterium]|nr:YqgE/AlgH family protein [Rhodospirillales bacterium]MCB9965856.1 YqgE/AlgH family protein [Rhodospirillales bacterium]MCB9973383.1 YqgE/AlgH family protein [Rhodospirillales bacterium]MCB9979643.1 YqgE/AlgH family protein [Rhodospirillales bacterium]
MTEMTQTLKGQLLIATPSMGDPRFHHAVILVCSHDAGGAMGLVINNILPGLSFDNMIEHLEVPTSAEKILRQIDILGGGPVESARGFVIHKSDYQAKDTIVISEDLSVTGTMDILKAIAKGEGPEPFLFILGYAGWTAGQLEQELKENAWLSVTPDIPLIFDVKPEQKWQMALAKLGIEPGFLSSNAGHA